MVACTFYKDFKIVLGFSFLSQAIVKKSNQPEHDDENSRKEAWKRTNFDHDEYR
jgi:hypothetical protein